MAGAEGLKTAYAGRLDGMVGAFFSILLENNESAIRKCYRKERLITIKSEAIAKFYVIENEVVR